MVTGGNSEKVCNFPRLENFPKMNHVNDCETGNRDLVVSIKKSETIDLMDYTDSGVKGLNDICPKYVIGIAICCQALAQTLSLGLR